MKRLDADRFVQIWSEYLQSNPRGNLSDARMQWISLGGRHVPLVSRRSINENVSWVISLQSTYGAYAQLETAHKLPRLLGYGLLPLLKLIEYLLRLIKIDQCVFVNSWLFSTSLYGPHVPPDLHECVDELSTRFVDTAICFRSLNTVQHADWLKALRRMGFILLVSRQVYLLPDPAHAVIQNRHLRKDLSFLRRSKLRILESAEFTRDHIAQAHCLYQGLYLGKYSRLNPEYDAALLAQWHASGMLEFRGLCGPDGRLLGFIAFATDGHQITQPMIGYQLDAEPGMGLYRLLMALGVEYAAKHRLPLHLSAGAPVFKRRRASQSAIEYNAIRLPSGRPFAKIALRAFSLISTWIAAPLMRFLRV